MKEIYLKRNWWIVLFFGPILAAGAAFCVYATTWPAVQAAQLGKPLPATWTWPTIIIADVAIVLLFGSLILIPLFQLRTVFTKEGVKMPGFFKSKFMRWTDVVYVDGVSIRSIILKLTDSKQSMTINKLYYREPDKLMGLLVEYVPQPCYWRD